MRLLILTLLLLWPAAASALPRVETLTTPAGIEVWYVRAPEIPMVALQAAWAGGAAAVPAERAGLAQLAMGLLDEGAGALDSTEFQSRLFDHAIKLGFGAGQDWLSLSLTTLSAHRALAAELVGLALTAPRFDAEPFERVKRQMIVAAERATQNPGAVAGRAWYAAAFPDHPYGRPVDGTRETLTGLTREDARAFAAARLGRGNLLVAAVGDLDPADLAALVDQAFGGLPATVAAVAVPAVAPRTAPQPIVIDRPLPQSVVVFGGAGIGRHDPDWYAASLANYLVGGGGFSARLQDEVREKRGLVYGISTSLQPSAASALLLGRFGTRNDQAGTALALARSVLATVRGNGLSAEELARAKQSLIAAYPLGLGSNAAIAGTVLTLRQFDLPRDQFERYADLVGAVTLDDLNRAARRLFNPAELLTVVVGKPEGIGG
jgi:zinc protease